MLHQQCRPECRDTVLRHADQRFGDRLMRAPSGASVMPDGVATQNKRHPGNRRNSANTEAAGDERVVQRARSNEPLAVDRMRGRGQQDEQIILGNAQLDVLALGENPIEDGCARFLNAPARPRGQNDRTRFSHLQIGRDGHVREVVTMPIEFDFSRASSLSSAPAGLRRHFRLDGDGMRLPGATAKVAPSAAASRRMQNGTVLPRKLCRASGFAAVPRNGPTFKARRGCSSACRKVSICAGRHQAGVIVLMAGERQAVTLDGVAR